MHHNSRGSQGIKTTDFADNTDVGIKPDRLGSAAAPALSPSNGQPPRFCARKTSGFSVSAFSALLPWDLELWLGL
jgi:hypothetical protein